MKMELIEHNQIYGNTDKDTTFHLKSRQMQCDITKIRSCWSLKVQLRE